MDSKLSPKQLSFVLAYIGEARFNATRAAKIAGYSERSAYAEGARLLKNDVIAARVRSELAARSMSAEAVLSELTDIALSDDNRFSSTFSDGESTSTRVDLNPKIKALEILAKAHGLLTDRVDISGSLTSTVEIVGVEPEEI